MQSQRLSIFGHIACMNDDADVQMILTAPPPNNLKRPPGRPRITWLNTVVHTERSSRPGPEPFSVEADVYSVVHANTLTFRRCDGG